MGNKIADRNGSGAWGLLSEGQTGEKSELNNLQASAQRSSTTAKIVHDSIFNQIRPAKPLDQGVKESSDCRAGPMKSELGPRAILLPDVVGGAFAGDATEDSRARQG
jgi:hypothetical protein